MSSTPANRSVLGRWPIATNTPVTGSVDVEPSTVDVTSIPSTVCSPRMSVTVWFHSNSILGLSKARSCMILLARNWSRRWMSVTLSANLVRNVASSTAESPPPTTAMLWPRKKKPSHVAHVESPCPSSFDSASSPSINDCAPVDTMIGVGLELALADPDAERALGEVDTRHLLREELGTEPLGLGAEVHHQLRSHDPVGEAGVVLDVGGEHQLPAGLIGCRRRLALDDERRAGWRGRRRSRRSGRPGRNR